MKNGVRVLEIKVTIKNSGTCGKLKLDNLYPKVLPLIWEYIIYHHKIITLYEENYKELAARIIISC
jgi:hypothetical protein